MKGKGVFIRNEGVKGKISKYLVRVKWNEEELAKLACEHGFTSITTPSH